MNYMNLAKVMRFNYLMEKVLAKQLKDESLKD
jgi:hypothetical protein